MKEAVSKWNIVFGFSKVTAGLWPKQGHNHKFKRLDIKTIATIIFSGTQFLDFGFGCKAVLKSLELESVGQRSFDDLSWQQQAI